MTFNYGDIIEYIDCTEDLRFEAARKWARTHNATFDELMDKRNLPKRYFQINEIIVPEPVVLPQPTPPEPTTEELQARVRLSRNYLLSTTDYTQLNDAPFTEEEKTKYAEYRKYLRDYTESENWWLQNPLTYDEWIAV